MGRLMPPISFRFSVALVLSCQAWIGCATGSPKAGPSFPRGSEQFSSAEALANARLLIDTLKVSSSRTIGNYLRFFSADEGPEEQLEAYCCLGSFDIARLREVGPPAGSECASWLEARARGANKARSLFLDALADELVEEAPLRPVLRAIAGDGGEERFLIDVVGREGKIVMTVSHAVWVEAAAFDFFRLEQIRGKSLKGWAESRGEALCRLGPSSE